MRGTVTIDIDDYNSMCRRIEAEHRHSVNNDTKYQFLKAFIEEALADANNTKYFASFDKEQAQKALDEAKEIGIYDELEVD